MANLNWVLDERKFLSRREVQRLLGVAQRRAERAVAEGRKVPVRDYFLVDLALSTGLRVTEMAQLKCGDVSLNDRGGFLIVTKGKGGKRRQVRFSQAFKRRCEEHLLWKRAVGEPTTPEAPLLLSSNTGGHMTARALEKAFKRTAAKADLPGYCSIHSLRHTYACELYKASGYNLRMVQKQLGHSNSRITEVYADVMNPDLRRALERLYS